MNALTEQVKKFISGLSKNERVLLYVAVPVLTAALVDLLFLAPVTSKLGALDEDINTQQDNIKKDMQFLEYKDKILKEKDGLKGFYNKKKQNREEVMNEFLKKIESFAREANIMIRTTPSQTEEKNGYTLYAVNLDCTGKLKGIVTFMHFVNSSDELLKISRYNVNSKKASAEDIQATMTITKAVVDPAGAQDNAPSADETAVQPNQTSPANGQAAQPAANHLPASAADKPISQNPPAAANAAAPSSPPASGGGTAQ